MVVNEDVDVYNMYEVIEAFAAKNHSSRGIFLYDEPGKGAGGSPCYNKADALALNGTLALFDCTFPLDWREEDLPIRSSFKDIYSKEVQEKVLQNWSKYGFQK
jgi:3-polyprenyl-4-hydroxybenzoate decarboxylase